MIFFIVLGAGFYNGVSGTDPSAAGTVELRGQQGFSPWTGSGDDSVLLPDLRLPDGQPFDDPFDHPDLFSGDQSGWISV